MQNSVRAYCLTLLNDAAWWNFKSHVTLTLTSDDLENHIVVNVSSALTNTTIWFVAALSLIVDVRTYVRVDGIWRTDIFTGLLGHLRRSPKNSLCSSKLLLHNKKIFPALCAGISCPPHFEIPSGASGLYNLYACPLIFKTVENWKKAASFNFTNPKTIFIAEHLIGPKIDLPIYWNWSGSVVIISDHQSDCPHVRIGL